MKKLLFLICLMFIFIPNIFAKEVNVYLFYGRGCSHCQALENYLDTKDNIKVYKYEIWFDYKNEKLLQEVSKITDVEVKGVPYYVIGSKTLQGYNDTENYRNAVDQAIDKALKESYYDDVGDFLLGENSNNDQEDNKDKKIITSIDTKEEKKDNNDKIWYVIGIIVLIDALLISLSIYKLTKKKL